MPTINYNEYISFIEKLPRKLRNEISSDPFRTMYIFLKVVYGYEIEGCDKYTKHYNDLMITENDIKK